jgi:hypothetical protein
LLSERESFVVFEDLEVPPVRTAEDRDVARHIRVNVRHFSTSNQPRRKK